MKNTKQGSALLIVLGFLSFMVVSAVAFSIYMRSERLPSSAMRRTVTTRHLVKAALARAIGDIDDALRAEPFPGCMGANGPTIQNAQSGKWSRYSNSRRASWVGRVFMPLAWMDRDGDEQVVQNRDDKQIDLTSDNGDLYSIPSIRLDRDSVSTLTLEGLGYVPPPLMNEARLLGRRSWSSAWRYFDYDAGRYAYTALNVSDYFDINRLNANTNRNSGGAGRISLAYLFADANGKVNQSQAENFDTFVSDTRGGEANSYPFVSMLDYSLALQKYLSGSLANPFFDRLTGGGNQSAFYGQLWGQMSAPNSSDALSSLMANTEYLKNARSVFLTDSWFGSTNTMYRSDVCDLSYPQWQPFNGFGGFPKGNGDLKACDNENNFWNKFINEFPVVATAMLYDYLDEDDVPLSLALPCVEQAPMLVGIELAANGAAIVITKSTENPQVAPGENPKTIITYSIGFQMQSVEVDVEAAFPFKRVQHKGNSSSFEVQAVGRLFFAPVGASGRTDGFGEVNWRNVAAGSEVRLDGNTSVLFVSNKQPVNVKDPKRIDECGSGVIQLAFPDPQQLGNLEILRVTKQEGVADNVEYLDGFKILTTAYEAVADGTTEVVPQLAVNIRITNSDGKTVDLVPARLVDDELNDRSNNKNAEEYNLLGNMNKIPLLRFQTSFPVSFKLDPKVLDNDVLGGVERKELTFDDWPNNQYLCADPRFNWAPEDWLARSVGGAGGSIFNDWLDLVEDDFLGKDSRDADIFMSVSNEGYLQSPYELMFIPRVSDLSKNHSPAQSSWGLLMNGVSRCDGAIKTSSDQLANYDLMWRTYRPTQVGGEDDFDALGIHADSQGFKVNPYTDNEMIFRAAIENTPYDWWAAGTNSVVSTKDDTDVTQLSEGLKYTFGPNSTDAGSRWSMTAVRGVATALQNKIRAGATADAWKGLYDDAWKAVWNTTDDNSDKLFGVDLQAAVEGEGASLDAHIHSVDRKFLYGFWRDCFACSQQLFLIFVRAESTALGGSGEGRTPGQLGGRAVALVWRDPKEPPSTWGPNDDKLELPHAMTVGEQSKAETRTPHKTRILFYHQFD